jgi:hypothetical protein
MGLDMYIKRVVRTNHSIDELRKIDNKENLKPDLEEAKPFLPLHKWSFGDYYSIFHEACYWRKFNALHNWFVTNVQLGVDDCDSYELTEEHIEDCLNVLKTVLETKDSSLLEPTSGFFFGSTAVDDYYFQDVEGAISQLEELLTLDWETNRFFYRASW